VIDHVCHFKGFSVEVVFLSMNSKTVGIASCCRLRGGVGFEFIWMLWSDSKLFCNWRAQIHPFKFSREYLF